MMHLSLVQSQNLAQRQELSQRLSTEQRLAVDQAQLQHRRELVEAVHGLHFKSKASCSRCAYNLTDLEIMRGFNDDPHDYTTQCPQCKERFPPRLARSTDAGVHEIAFYCPEQTLELLRELTETPLAQLREQHAEAYYSAIVHFGGIQQAFGKIDLEYGFPEQLEWRSQVGPFLGKLPDTVIADLVGTNAREIRALRNQRNIPSYSRRREAELLC